MSPRYLTEADIVERLRALCAGRLARDVAAELGVSPQYLTDVVHGRRPPAEKIASALGYDRKTLFVKREG